MIAIIHFDIPTISSIGRVKSSCQDGDMKTIFFTTTLLFTLTAFANARLEIIKIGHPTLRATAMEVNHADITSPEFQSLIDDMIDTMGEAGGVGLAAPQVDKSLRMFVMKS